MALALELWTGQVGNSYCPQVKLEVWITSEDGDKVYYDWYMYYITHGYAAYTNGYSRSVTATVGGDTLSGSININGITGTHLINSGSSWLGKEHGSRWVSSSVSMYFDVSWNGVYSEYISASGGFSINPKTSYTVSYNANGGSGAPSSQTKWYGETLTLSSAKPTRDGYTFAGWGTSASATGVSYSAGGSYTSNAAITLYAVWIDNKSVCTIAYDANGGSGAPSSQSHVQSTVSKLSGVKPTKDGYVFLGWSLKSYSTKATWIANGRYAYDDFADGDTITLYAVWKRVDRIWINVPDGTSVSAIHVKVPDGKSLNDVYFRIEETYITTSDGATLADSSGNYLILKDG